MSGDMVITTDLCGCRWRRLVDGAEVRWIQIVGCGVHPLYVEARS